MKKENRKYLRTLSNGLKVYEVQLMGGPGHGLTSIATHDIVIHEGVEYRRGPDDRYYCEPNEKEKAGYLLAIKDMALKAHAWFLEHPESNAIVQWNYPGDVMVVGLLEDAVQQHLVTVNSDGTEMLKAMGAMSGERSEPTVGMLRFAFEFMDQIVKEEGGENGITKRS